MLIQQSDLVIHFFSDSHPAKSIPLHVNWGEHGLYQRLFFLAYTPWTTALSSFSNSGQGWGGREGRREAKGLAPLMENWKHCTRNTASRVGAEKPHGRPSGGLAQPSFSQCVVVPQSCPTLWNPLDCSLPGSSVHRILQARILNWVAILFFRGSSWPRGRTCTSCISGRYFTI